MKWRRLRSGMGSPPEPAVPAYRRFRMPWKRPQVLGADLNRSESSLTLTNPHSIGISEPVRHRRFQGKTLLNSRPVLLLLPQPRHGTAGQPGLLSISRVPLDLVQSLVAADRRDLLGRAPSVRQSHTGRLAQAVRGELLAGLRRPVEADSPAPLAEPFREALLVERRAVAVDQKYHVPGRAHRGDGGGGLVQHRNGELRARLLLDVGHRAIANVAGADLDHVGASGGKVEQERQRRPLLGAERVAGFEVRDLVVFPRGESVALGELHF